MNSNEQSKNDVLKMMSLSDEINTLNIKIKQLVEDLSSTQDVLGGVQELASQLTGKVGELKNASDGYTVPNYSVDDDSTVPSYKDGVNKRERIVPTPENMSEYTPQVASQPKAQSESTTTTRKAVVDERVPKSSGVRAKQEMLKGTKSARKKNTKKKSGWGFSDRITKG